MNKPLSPITLIAKLAEIDQLIDEKKQLIALYKEERTATINEAVTKGLPGEERAKVGLDANVPMRDRWYQLDWRDTNALGGEEVETCDKQGWKRCNP